MSFAGVLTRGDSVVEEEKGGRGGFLKGAWTSVEVWPAVFWASLKPRRSSGHPGALAPLSFRARLSGSLKVKTHSLPVDGSYLT